MTVPHVDGLCPRCDKRHDSRNCPLYQLNEYYCETHESPASNGTAPCDHILCIQHGFWNRDGRLILKLIGRDLNECEIVGESLVSARARMGDYGVA
jgi:hypothetical protein